MYKDLFPFRMGEVVVIRIPLSTENGQGLPDGRLKGSSLVSMVEECVIRSEEIVVSLHIIE